MGSRNPSLRIRFGRRRTEGNKKPQQCSASWRTGSECSSSVAGTHTLSLGRRLDFCQPALPRQNSIHVPDPLPSSHSPVIERVSGLKSCKQAPIGWHTLRRSLATLLVSNGENVKVTQSQLRHTTPKITLELYAQAVSADQQKAHRKVVRMVLPLKFPEKLKAKSATTTL